MRRVARNLLFPFPLLAIFFCFCFAPRPVQAEVWPVERSWTAQEEDLYSAWFERLASREWHSVNDMLHNPDHNTLADPADKRLHFYSDCADLPYIIRAYYAYKRHLPFVGNLVDGSRYGKKPNTTVELFDNLSFDGSVQAFFTKVNEVSSANYRTAPDDTESFTYPLAITRQALRPGMVFYSPDGHVAMVAQVEDDGTIKLVDAHPDQTVTRISFGPKLEVKSRTESGGFRGIRPAVVRDGQAVFITDNSQLPGYSPEQYAFHDYYTTVAQRLATFSIDPVAALDKYIREDTFQEVLDRLHSVDLGWKAAQGHVIAPASNIYDAEGDWEDFSTCSRDLRLRLSMLAIPTLISSYMRMLREHPEQLNTPYKNPRDLGQALLARKDQLFQELTFQYTNSAGQMVTLKLADVEQRLFRLSFDPNDPPELRWGASGEELDTMEHGEQTHLANYRREQFWRNRLEKKRGAMDPYDDDNPRQEPPHDLDQMIAQVVQQEPSAQGRLAAAANPAPTSQPARTLRMWPLSWFREGK